MRISGHLPALLCALMLCGPVAAYGQSPAPGAGPVSGASMLVDAPALPRARWRILAAPVGQTARPRPARLSRLDPVAIAGGSDHEVRLDLSRTTRRIAGNWAGAAAAQYVQDGARVQRARTPHMDGRPRTVATTVRIEDHIALSDTLALTLGWQGQKVANYNAAVTSGGSRADRLVARDWFLPFVQARISPGDGVDASLAYREGMRAFADTGTIGPAGADRDAFARLREHMRAQTARAATVRVAVSAGPAGVAIGAYHIAYAHYMAHDDGAVLPVDAGAVRADGVRFDGRMTLDHRLDLEAHGHMARYTGAQDAASTLLPDRRFSLGARWRAARWHALVRAVAVRQGGRDRPARVEAALGYAPGEAPFRLEMRMGQDDPMPDPDGTGRVDPRSRDRHRAMMLNLNASF